MASEKGDYQVSSLIDLFPHPLPYLGLKGEDVKGLAEGLVKSLGRPEEGNEWFDLYEVCFWKARKEKKKKWGIDPCFITFFYFYIF